MTMLNRPEYLAPLAPDSSPTELDDSMAASDELSLWSAIFGVRLLDQIELRADLRVLDLATGEGFPMLELAERLGPSSRVYGLDTWLPGLVHARHKAQAWQVHNALPVNGDGAHMPFASGQFDVLVSNLGINNFDNVLTVLAECCRVARPGARMYITTNLQGHMAEFYNVLRATLLELNRADLLPALDAHIDHRTTLDRLVAWLTESGFRVVRIREERAMLRYLDGSAFLRHHFIRLGFMDAWREIVPAEAQADVFTRLEQNLNQAAAAQGELRLTIPLALVTAVKEEGGRMIVPQAERVEG